MPSKILSVLVLVALFPFHHGLAQPVEVKHTEGITHGFLILRSLDGRILATGDQIQTVEGNQVTTETVFHFKDGSLHDETSVYLQDHTFHMLSYHLTQKGPMFPHPTDASLDVSNHEVTIHATEKNQQKDAIEHMDLTPDLVNGFVTTVLKNIPPSAAGTKVPMLVLSAKPRLVHLVIKSIDTNSTFAIAGSRRKALHFQIHIDLGGVAGVVAPLLGKKPPDIHIWLSDGRAPTFLRSQGPLFEGGPIWRIDLAAPQMPETSGK
jgi:hypothetical protein